MGDIRIKVKGEVNCPTCKAVNFDITDSGLDDGGYFYDQVCFECDQHYTVWYDVIYSETIYLKEDENGRD
jgi:hypothetical protein